MRNTILSLTAIAAIAVAGGVAAKPLADSASAQAFHGHKLARLASVSLADARSIALAARPGVITDQELEKEKGGSGLRYSFDIRSGGATYEVGVDARTRQVLEDSREGAHPD